MDMDVSLTSNKHSTSTGYSLIELIISLGIAVILINLAAPAGAFLLNDTKTSAEVNRFAGELQYARSQAVKQSRHVSICKSLDQLNCASTGEWHNGWIIFVDHNRDRARNSGEPLLRKGSIDTASINLKYSAFPTSNYVVYYPSGRSLGNGTFTFCDTSGNATPRALVLYKTGRLRTDNVMPDGSSLICP